MILNQYSAQLDEALAFRFSVSMERINVLITYPYQELETKIIMITCKYCIMDTTCDISFNIEGRCNYYLEFEDKLSKIKKMI